MQLAQQKSKWYGALYVCHTYTPAWNDVEALNSVHHFYFASVSYQRIILEIAKRGDCNAVLILQLSHN